ncbi:MAG: VCBS repeat-containing protein [Flavobacterium sp.]|nr:VCBS repeat-containing protein [Flavobacterium sp.]
MKQKLYFLFTLFWCSILSFGQTNSFIASTCIGTTTGSQARLYNSAVADYDGDNDKDIIVSDESGVYRLFTNDGANNFTSATIGVIGSVFPKDMDNDNDIDIVSNAGKIFINNGSAVFTQLPGTFFTATGSISNFEIADFNGDNKQDILWLNGATNSASNNQLWINNGTTGNANFVLSSEFDNLGIFANFGSATGDIDSDGDVDLTISGQGGWAGKVYKNNGAGVFTVSQNFTTYTGNGNLVDWDKDGDLDFVAFDYYNAWGLRLWKNDGAGTFGTVSPSSLLPAITFYIKDYTLVDLNGDTWLDVVLHGNSANIGSRYYLNSGCQFTLASQVLSNAANGVAISDFNNDGKPDVFNAARDAQSCIYLNDLNVQSYVAITQPVTTTQINYTLGQTTPQLSATGNNLLWYATATGGTGSATAPAPSTATVGNTSYWVSSTNANGCESARVEIVVTVTLPATHLNFDGTNDYINLGNILPTSYTKEAWVYTTSLSLNTNFISGGVSDGKHCLWAPTGYSNRLSAGHNEVWDHVQDPTPLALNTWYHIAVTYDAATTTMKLYKNGVLVSTNNTVPPFSNGNMVRLGAYENASNLLQGNMDEVRIWNVARTAEQINGSRNCELAGPESGLVAYYNFNQGNDAGNNSTVTTLTAMTGPSGTLTNFALAGATSNWLAGSPVTTGSFVPAVATVTTPVVRNQGDTAPTLTATIGANGTGLLWYTTATGGTGSATAPTLSTATVGSTSYWVSSTNANGCESARVEIVFTVNALVSATHLNFDGTNDYVTIPATAINNLPQGTIETWVYLNSLNQQTICSKQSNGENSYAILAVGGGSYDQGAPIAGQVSYQSKNGSIIKSTGPLLQIGQWYHLAITFTNTQARLYINGVLNNTVNANFSLPNDVTVTATSIGAWLGDGGGQYFNGNIDEFRVWNAVLTPTEINNLKDCEAQAQPELVTYYKFNQGYDGISNTGITSLTDSAGSNNGTLTNFALSGATSNWKSGSPVTAGNTCTSLSTVGFNANSNFKIYPNPTQNEINIELNSVSNARLEVFDINGRLLQKQSLNTSQSKLDINQFPSGMYLFKVTSNEGTATTKVVKQ